MGSIDKNRCKKNRVLWQKFTKFRQHQPKKKKHLSCRSLNGNLSKSVSGSKASVTHTHCASYKIVDAFSATLRVKKKKDSYESDFGTSNR